MAAVSVAEVCDSLDVTVSLKWPNDVLIEGRKLAGILCEARGTPQAWTVVVGIGLNIFRPSSGYPEDIPAIALDERTDHPLDPKAIAPAIVQRLDGHLRSLSRDGAAPVLAAWERRGYPLGSSLRRGDIVGTFAGLTDEGALRLKTETGIQTVHAGDVDIIA
jgi:BirA family biotin operon repressor/biotin-[acetyl-CoA-carboxylase] ligase